MENRIKYIDLLKTIGLISIIIAHVNPPKWLFMFRQYDVILMVVISATLSYQSYNKTILNGKKNQYCISRFRRLIIPTWLFLVVYFFIEYINSGVFDKELYFYSFLLTRYGIGYIWVILIYFISSLLIPFFYKIQLKIVNIIYLLIAYIVYELLYYYQIGLNIKVVDTVFYYLIPYGIVTFLGYNYFALKRKYRICIMIVGLMIYVIMCGYYLISTSELVDVQIAKYPPRLYYLSYGIGISFIFLEIFRNIDLKLFNSKMIKYISTHSMWIYLWHILAMDIYDTLYFPKQWYIKFIGVFTISVGLVFIINTILDKTRLDKYFVLLSYFRK